MKRLTCICLPDESSSKRIKDLMIQISDECDSKNALFFPPHISIMGDFEIEEEKLDQLINDMEKTISSFGRVSFRTTKFDSYPWKIVYLDIVKSPQLSKMHAQIMEVIQKYRTSWVPPYLLENKVDFEDRQYEYIQKFGYQFAFEYFSPHFSLAGNDIDLKRFEKVMKKYKDREEIIDGTFVKIDLVDRNNNNFSVREFRLQ